MGDLRAVTGFEMFYKRELVRLMSGPMWKGAAAAPIGRGDPDLERAEATGLLLRTPQGFVLTPDGLRALEAQEGQSDE